MLVPVPVGSVEVAVLPDIPLDGPVILRLPPITDVKAFKRAKKAHHAARARTAVPAAFAGNSVVLKNGAVALDLKIPGPQDLTTAASVGVDLPSGSVNAQARTSVGREGNDPAFWQKNAAKVDANVGGPLGTRLSLSGQDEFGFTYRPPESVGASDSASHMVRTENRSVDASVSAPVGAVQVTVGGGGSSTTTQDTSKLLSATGRALVGTDDRSLFAKAEWQPRTWLNVEGGARARAADITWRAQHAHNSTYRSLDPHISVTVRPLDDTTVVARVEHKVSPYDTAAFAGIAAANPPSGTVGFEPDHVWELQMQMQQKLGPASLSATYTADRQGSATEFAAQNGTQQPASTRLDRRDDVAVALNLPLSGFGLPGTDLSSQAEWQSSQVLDPVTQELRSASGQIPRKVTLRLSHNLPKHNLSLGLTGEFTGSSSFYQTDEVTSTADGGSVGAFIKYKPGSYEVELNVHGLYGGSTENTYYEGLRGSSDIGRSVLKDNSGTLINLSLHKAL